MELQALRTLAQESKKKKNKMDGGARAEAAQLLTRIWSDETVDPTGAFESMNELQSEALAEGVGKAWPQMGDGRRQQFLSWLPAPTTERASRRIALTAAAIIADDAKTATDLLCRLLPAGQKSMNKELRHTLRTALFGDKRVEFGILNQSGVAPQNLLRLYSALAELAFAASSDISPVVRSQLALAVQASLTTLRDHDVEKASQLGALLETQIKAWPTALQIQYHRQLGATKSASAGEHPTSGGAPASGLVGPIQPPSPISSVPASSDILSEFSKVEKHLNDRLTAISNEMNVLGQLGKLLADFKGQYSSLRAELESAKQSAVNSVENVQRISEANRLLQDQLQQAKSRASELSKTLDQFKQESEEERRRLSQQISAIAARQ